jgi:hypothetical protein
MASKGLRFAPAVSGEQDAYLALHHALVNYNNLLQSQIGSKE